MGRQISCEEEGDEGEEIVEEDNKEEKKMMTIGRTKCCPVLIKNRPDRFSVAFPVLRAYNGSISHDMITLNQRCS